VDVNGGRFVHADHVIAVEVRLLDAALSIVISPFSAALSPKIIALRICCRMIAGLTVWPQSVAQTTLWTLTFP
jgi:hypothetical protein